MIVLIIKAFKKIADVIFRMNVLLSEFLSSNLGNI